MPFCSLYSPGAAQRLVRLACNCLVVLYTIGAHGAAPGDIRLLIDISGSMRINDPLNLRVPAVNLLVKMAPAGATVGVWTFGQSVNALVPHQQVDDAWKTRALQKTATISSNGLYTNIGGVLDELLLGQPAGAAILLTDGVVDIGKDPLVNAAERQRILNDLLPKLIAQGTLVHAVALSDKADSELLEQLARATGGVFEIAASSADLTRIFLRLFDDAVHQDRLPMTENVFLVDSSVEEFTLLAFRGAGEVPVQLRSPDNAFYLAADHPAFISWYEDKGFDLITVRQPLEGGWRLFADEKTDNRVTVLSDLQLQVSNLHNTIYMGDVPELTVAFSQQDQPLVEADFLALLDVQLIALDPQGTRLAKRLTDPVGGIYRSPLDVLQLPGHYEIKVSVDGITFQREYVQTIEYSAPVSVDYVDDNRVLHVLPLTPTLLADGLTLTAGLTLGEQRQPLLLTSTSDGDWTASLADLPPGLYSLDLQVQGQSNIGQPLAYELKAMPLTVGAAALAASAAVDPAGEETAEDNFYPYLIYGLIGVGNLLLIGFGVWFYRRRESAAADGPDAELAALLKGELPAAVAPTADAITEPELEKTVQLQTSPVAAAEEAAAPESVVEPELEPEPVDELADDDDSESRDLDDAVAAALADEVLAEATAPPALDADAELAAFARSGESEPEPGNPEDDDPATPPPVS